MGPHIFISGTYLDIKEFRQAAYDALRRRATVETMEDFPNTEETPPNLCLQRLLKCSHYILIVGKRYGWIPPGFDVSITELEYNWAKKRNMPIKIYIYEPKRKKYALSSEPEHKQILLEKFKSKLREENSPRDFKSVDNLKHLLELTLRDWFEGDNSNQDGNAESMVSSNVMGNITGSLIVAGSNNQIFNGNNAIPGNNATPQDYHLEQLGRVFEEQLDKFVELRLKGDIDGAWNELKKSLMDFSVRKPPDKVAARYFLLAAQWALIDFPSSEESARYFEQATSLFRGIDTRAYRARLLMNAKQYDEALEVLKPFDKENVILVALQILLDKGSGNAAQRLIEGAQVKLTHATRQILALCYLQARDFGKAEMEIQAAIREFPTAPTYHLIAGLVSYWKAIPADLSQLGNLYPMFFNTNVFHPNVEQSAYLEEALKHFDNAKKYADTIGHLPTINSIKESWLLTAVLLPSKREEVNKQVLTILAANPCNKVALVYAVENELTLDEDKNIKPLIDIAHSGGLDSACVTVLVRFYQQKGQYIEAHTLLDKYKVQFLSEHVLLNWLLLKIDCFLLDNNYEKAKELLSDATDLDELEKLEFKSTSIKRQDILKL